MNSIARNKEIILMLSLGVVKWFLQYSCVSFCVSELHPLPAFPGKFLLHLTKHVVHRKTGKSCYQQNLKQSQDDCMKKPLYSPCGTTILTLSFYCSFYGWSFSRYTWLHQKILNFDYSLDLGISLGAKPSSRLYDGGTFSSSFLV